MGKKERGCSRGEPHCEQPLGTDQVNYVRNGTAEARDLGILPAFDDGRILSF